MTTPSDSNGPPQSDFAVPAGSEPEPAATVPAAAPESPAPEAEKSTQDRGGKLKAAALAGGAAALAKKVRSEAPKKVQEFREKRVAGRCVILTELGGRQVAIGPYRDDQGARRDVAKVPGDARVVELLSQQAYFTRDELQQLR